MARRVAVRFLYIEFIICGFLACVLVARNLCLSENGTPISCPGSRLGNATGKGASDGASSGGKVKVQGEGEVLNMGAKRNVKRGKKFRPLFLVSKDRPRSTPPKTSREGSDANGKKPRLLKVEKEMPGNEVVEPQWPDAGLVEKSEVMQSRGQLPEEQRGVFEFLDMFEVSDWLSNRRRKKGEAVRRSEGSKEREVDSKEQWLVASKEAEQDDEDAEDSSKMKEGERAASKDEPEGSKERAVDSKAQWFVASKEAEQDDEEAEDSSKGERAASKDEQVSSQHEVLRSIISKAKPVRIRSTIVAKAFLPRTKLLRGSRSKAVVEDTDGEVTSTAGAVASGAGPLTDRKPGTLAGLDAADTGLNRANASSQAPTEINPNGKDPFSASKTHTSSLEKEESSALGFSDDDSGIFGDILNAIFRDDDDEEEDSIETPEELAFDEVDVLEAAKRDADELMDRLDIVSVDTSEDATMSRDESSVVEDLAELREKLAAVNAEERGHYEDAENGYGISGNQVGSDEDVPTAVEYVPSEPIESYNVSEGSVDVSTRGNESSEVSLNQEQNSFDDVLEAKDAVPLNENDASYSSRNDSYNTANETEEIVPEVGKKIHEKAEDKLLISGDNNDSSKRKDFQLKATDVPVLLTANDIVENTEDVHVTGKLNPVKGEIIPLKGEIIPVKEEIIPMKGKIIPVKGEIIPVKGEIIPAKGEIIPVKEEIIPLKGEIIPVKEEIIPLKGKIIPVKGKYIPVEGKIIHVKGEYIIPRLAKDARTHAKATDDAKDNDDITVQAADTRSTTDNVLNIADEGLPADIKDILAKALDIRSVVEDIPVKAGVLPSTAEASYAVVREGVSETATDKPATQEGIVSKQNDLSKKAKEMPEKAKAIPNKQEDVSKKANGVIAKAEAVGTKPEDLSKKAKELPASDEVTIVKQDDVFQKADDMAEKAKAIPTKQDDLSHKVKEMPATEKGILVIQGDLSKKSEDIRAEVDVNATKQRDLSNKTDDLPAKTKAIATKQEDLSKKTNDMPEKAEVKAAKQDDLSKTANDMIEEERGIASKQEDLSKKAKEMPEKAKAIPNKQEDLSKTAKEMPEKAKAIPTKQDDLSKKAKEMPEKAKAIPTKQDDLSKKASDMAEEAVGKSTKQEDLSKKASDMAEEAVGKATKQEDLSKKAEEMLATKEGIIVKQKSSSSKAKKTPEKAMTIETKQGDLSRNANDMPDRAEEKATKQGDLPEITDDVRSKSEGKATEQEDVSKSTDDTSPEPEDTTEQDEPVSKQLQVDESRDPGKAELRANDTSDEDGEPSAMDKEEVKMAMFTEMGNIMSDLNYLGTLWEQLKPGMKLKNTDAVRKVLHAVSNVFGLDKKAVVSQPGLDRGRTAAERLRYDLKVQQRSKNDGQGRKGFKDVSSRDGPSRGQKKRVGLRSRRSLQQGANRRRLVQEVGERRDRRARRGRHGDSSSEGRKHKRRSEGRLARDGGEEEEEEENEDNEEQDIVVEEDWSNKNLNEGRVRKRTGYEDYIFGNNPGYVLSRRRRRRRRGAPPPGGPIATAAAAATEDRAKNRVEDNAEDRAEDRAEEDAISRELANLLIEKVYNRVMKSLKTPPKLENEAAAQKSSSAKPNEIQRDDDDDDVKLEERRKRNFGSDASNVRRSKRNVDNVDMASYCSMLARERYNVTDENGQVTDLYREAINSGMCRDFHMAQFAEAAAEEAAERKAELEAEREVEREALEKRNSKTFAVDREQGKLEKDVGKRGTAVEVDEGMEERAVEGASREVENESEMVVEREAERESKEEGESSREEDNEEVIEREVKPDVRGARQREAQEEVNKREIDDETERTVRMEVGGEAARQEEQTGNEVERMVDEEGDNDEEEEKEVENDEVLLDTKEEEEEMVERRADDEAMEELNSSAKDAWDFASKDGDHLRRRVFNVDKRSVGENVNRRARKRKDRLEKSRRWSNAEDETENGKEKVAEKGAEEAEKNEAETDKNVDEFITLLNPMGVAVGQGRGQGQGQGQ